MRRMEVVGVETGLPIGVSDSGRQILVWGRVIEDLRAADFDRDDLAAFERVAGFQPSWGVEIAISGNFEAWRHRDLRALTTWLLSDGGCATSIELDEFKTAEQWRETWAG